MRLVKDVVERARACGRKIGICGQAPSDYPEFARFLVEEGIDSISLNPDSVLRTIGIVAEAERMLPARPPCPEEEEDVLGARVPRRDMDETC